MAVQLLKPSIQTAYYELVEPRTNDRQHDSHHHHDFFLLNIIILILVYIIGSSIKGIFSLYATEEKLHEMRKP